MTKVISIAFQKGGVGKTTTATSIATGLSMHNKKVLLIDIDPQANSSKLILADKYFQSVNYTSSICSTIMDRSSLFLLKTRYSNLDLIPSHIGLAAADLSLAGAMDIVANRLKKQLDKIKNDYDYVIIDCPPALNMLTMNAFSTSDSFICPIKPGQFESDAIPFFFENIALVREDYNPDLKFEGFLVTMSTPTNATKEFMRYIRTTYGDMIIDSIVPHSTKISEALLLYKSIYEHAPTSPSALAYKKILYKLNLL